ncbi:MAG TPA: DUF3073 domain-containing protein [Jatrophihabitans sp.]|nr:DUF3073 domain-containing protein [Jatrophihabitans sp.]
MGRGRAKAKQQKVARELKYNTQSTDFTALQRELGHSADSNRPDDSADPYADEGYEDEESWVGGSSR